MSHRVGLHWIRVHPDGADFDHIRRMGYRSAKLFEWMWNDRDLCNALLAALPGDALLLARHHPRSEEKEGIWSDPVGHGRRHAEAWAKDIQEGRYHLPIHRSYFLPVNEPDATSGDRAKIDTYTASYLDRLAALGLKGGAFNFSTGHPRTKDGTPNTPPDYSVFEASHRAIMRGGHIAVAHIYGTAAQPCVPGHFDRLRSCPWQDVTWVIGECGVDEHVVGGGPHYGYQHGFAGRLNEYAAWLDALIVGTDDPRIHSWQVFSYDFSHPWEGFDVRPIRGALETYPWRDVTPPKPAPPPVPSGPHVAVEAGANVRSGPGTEHSIVKALPQYTPVTVDGRNAAGDWLRLRAPVAGWVSAALLAGVPDGLPVVGDGGTVYLPVVGAPSGPQDAERNWQRSIDFVLRWEGGYQNVPNDSGNWTGGAVGKGENRGTKYGISAARYPHLDIRNLTLDRAKVLYRRDYWQASGADKQPWPLCLLVMDTAVLHGVGAATTWLREVGPNPLAFAAKRLRVYVGMGNWDYWGKAWVRRVADLLEAMKGE